MSFQPGTLVTSDEFGNGVVVQESSGDPDYPGKIGVIYYDPLSIPTDAYTGDLSSWREVYPAKAVIRFGL